MVAAQLVPRGIQQLDKILHNGGHIIRLRSSCFDQRRRGCHKG